MQFQKVNIIKAKQEEIALTTLFPEKLETPYYEHFPANGNNEVALEFAQEAE